MKLREICWVKKVNRVLLCLFLAGIISACGKESELKSDIDANVIEGTTSLPPLRVADYTLEETIPNVLVDQIGYEENSTKIVIFKGENLPELFEVVEAESKEVVYTGKIIPNEYQEDVGESTGYGVFTQLQKEGKYYIRTERIGQSFPFQIDNNIYQPLLLDVCKSFYENRCGKKQTEVFNEQTRPHPCFSSEFLIEEGNIDLSGGWHTSDDFSRDVMSGCMAASDLMLVYRLYPSLFLDDLGLETSGNEVPDMIDEVRYEIDWLLKMQNSKTGMVYRGIQYETQEAEENATNPGRLVLQNEDDDSTAMFAATLAEFYLVYSEYDSSYATKCLRAAEKAWASLPKKLDNTQEQYFAAASLYNATGKVSYHNYVKTYRTQSSLSSLKKEIELRGDVMYLNSRRKVDTALCNEIMKEWMEKVEVLAKESNQNAYRVCGTTEDEIFDNLFYLTIINHVITNHEYGTVLGSHLHYFLGRNPEGISYFQDKGYRHLKNNEKMKEITGQPQLSATMLLILGESVSGNTDMEE